MVSEKGCQKVGELLSPYLDGQVSSEEKKLVEAHLERCEACRFELDSLRATVGLLRRVPSVTPRRSFAIQASPPPSPRPFLLNWIPVGVLRGATGLAVVLLLGLVLGDALGTFSTIPAEQQLASSTGANQAPQPGPSPRPQPSGDSEAMPDEAFSLAPEEPAVATPEGLERVGGGTEVEKERKGQTPAPAEQTKSTPIVTAPVVDASSAEAISDGQAPQAFPVRQIEVALSALVTVLVATLIFVTWKGKEERRKKGV